ncbi:DHH family phosphoesterase [Candidatus Nomurabacteria bacterium]|nr:DHH family phosphoesterase [Candidatus Nomurabacteria bacterium]MCB9827216.1 DHH family phosphoesterase [Candidatus Nomurabacteria bacterium]MCB9827500.1 DHH family phosphoesterase [Candidatus Nomurabacteria bacterium]HXK52645.1 DHH family phosphoesterase [bacterium]
MRIFVIGHKSPDLDSVAAPVAYAEYLRLIGRYEDAELIAVSAEKANAETEFVFNKFEMPLPKTIEDFEIDASDSFVLVDHSEDSQRSEKVIVENIIEIIDHHKTNVNVPHPIRIDIKPLGSTATLVYEYFKFNSIKPAKGIMGILLSSILSDTQGLKSSTTTGEDYLYAHDMARALGLIISDLTFEIFKAKSNIAGLSVEDLVVKDYKIFDFGGKNVLINQIETVEPEIVIEMKDKILPALKNLKQKLDIDMAFFVITDILQINSKIICETKKEQAVAEKAFTASFENDIADIGPKMSRKKDIAPALEKTINNQKK